MNTASQECIWKDQCGMECPGRCSDFTPADDAGDNEDYYSSILKENTEEYQHMINNYSDKGMFDSES